MWQSSNGHEKGKENRCSFCGKSEAQVGQLITGPGDVSICRECTELFREQIEQMAGELASMKQLWRICSSCGTRVPASHRYCHNCGTQFTKE